MDKICNLCQAKKWAAETPGLCCSGGKMTSFGAKEIREGNFMPTFKVQGQVYHLIGDLLPSVGAQLEFLQIYFVSHADQF
nr:uncharacterized protein LOC118681904 isoform X2 [Bactrocera oleae]XP_036226591.1 uncharacterized protein LOC118682310 isoform X3 [Bactrocera oleae]